MRSRRPSSNQAAQSLDDALCQAEQNEPAGQQQVRNGQYAVAAKSIDLTPDARPQEGGEQERRGEDPEDHGT